MGSRLTSCHFRLRKQLPCKVEYPPCTSVSASARWTCRRAYCEVAEGAVSRAEVPRICALAAGSSSPPQEMKSGSRGGRTLPRPTPTFLLLPPAVVPRSDPFLQASAHHRGGLQNRPAQGQVAGEQAAQERGGASDIPQGRMPEWGRGGAGLNPCLGCVVCPGGPSQRLPGLRELAVVGHPNTHTVVLEMPQDGGCGEQAGGSPGVPTTSRLSPRARRWRGPWAPWPTSSALLGSMTTWTRSSRRRSTWRSAAAAATSGGGSPRASVW